MEPAGRLKDGRATLPRAGDRFSVSGYPPAKNEAKSMLAAGRIYAERVFALLRAAAAPSGEMLLFPNERLGLELIVVAPAAPPSDATNYLDGVADVLEEKTRRALKHLADLSTVALYRNDRQIEEVCTTTTVAASRRATRYGSGVLEATD